MAAYSVAEIKPYHVEDGVVTIHADEPTEHFAIKCVSRDDQGRRITTYLGEGYSRENADLIAQALNALPSPSQTPSHHSDKE